MAVDIPYPEEEIPQLLACTVISNPASPEQASHRLAEVACADRLRRCALRWRPRPSERALRLLARSRRHWG
jgi:hypothetical protein